MTYLFELGFLVRGHLAYFLPTCHQDLRVSGRRWDFLWRNFLRADHESQVAEGPISVTGTAGWYLQMSDHLFLILDSQWSFCHCHGYVTLAIIDLGCNRLSATMLHFLVSEGIHGPSRLLVVRLADGSLARGQTEKVLPAVLILIKQISALHTRLI